MQEQYIFFSLWSLNNQWHPILHLEVITSRSQQWKLLILITKSKLQAIIPVGFLFQVLDTKWCHLYYSKGSMKSPWLPSLWSHQSLGWQSSELQLSFQDLPLSTEIYHEQKVSTSWLLSNEPSKVGCQPGRLMLSFWLWVLHSWQINQPFLEGTLSQSHKILIRASIKPVWQWLLNNIQISSIDKISILWEFYWQRPEKYRHHQVW